MIRIYVHFESFILKSSYPNSILHILFFGGGRWKWNSRERWRERYTRNKNASKIKRLKKKKKKRMRRIHKKMFLG
jgi:hypothetical protein